MTIINATPDSFYEGSRTPRADDVARRAERAVADGAAILDVGGYSSRPGADDVTPDEELRREVVAEDKAGCCQRLLRLALERGAPDNVTAVLVQL